jgi:hypothetical protein
MVNKNVLDNKILFFFTAKKVKRDFLYQSREILQKKNIKLVKATTIIEKNIRKIRLLDNIVKSSTLVGISSENFDFSFSRQLSNMEIPGLDFLGVLKNDQYFSKKRLNSIIISKEQVLYKTYNNCIKTPQVLSNFLVNPISLTLSYTKTL